MRKGKSIRGWWPTIPGPPPRSTQTTRAPSSSSSSFDSSLSHRFAVCPRSPMAPRRGQPLVIGPGGREAARVVFVLHWLVGRKDESRRGWSWFSQNSRVRGDAPPAPVFPRPRWPSPGVRPDARRPPAPALSYCLFGFPPLGSLLRRCAVRGVWFTMRIRCRGGRRVRLRCRGLRMCLVRVRRWCVARRGVPGR